MNDDDDGYDNIVMKKSWIYRKRTFTCLVWSNIIFILSNEKLFVLFFFCHHSFLAFYTDLHIHLRSIYIRRRVYVDDGCCYFFINNFACHVSVLCWIISIFNVGQDNLLLELDEENFCGATENKVNFWRNERETTPRAGVHIIRLEIENCTDR